MFANSSWTDSLSADNFQDHNGANGSCLLPIDHVAVMISYATIYSVLMIVSLVGNSLLIYSSLNSDIKMAHTIANTAASDLLFSIVHLPRTIVAEIKGSTTFLVHGSFGLLLCKIYNFITDVTIAVSTLSLVLTSVDRFLAVVFPIKYRRISVKKRRFLIFSTWLLAMAIHSPYFYTFRLNSTRNGETFCTSNWEPAFHHETTNTRYYTALLVTVLIVPLVTVSMLHTLTSMKLRSDKLTSFRSSIANQKHTKTTKKLLMMSIAITLAFAFCWLPFLVLQFVYLYFSSSVPSCSLSFAIFDQFAVLLSLCHCIVNPFICFIFVRHIRVLKPFNAITQRRSCTCMVTKL